MAKVTRWEKAMGENDEISGKGDDDGNFKFKGEVSLSV